MNYNKSNFTEEQILSFKEKEVNRLLVRKILKENNKYFTDYKESDTGIIAQYITETFARDILKEEIKFRQDLEVAQFATREKKEAFQILKKYLNNEELSNEELEVLQYTYYDKYDLLLSNTKTKKDLKINVKSYKTNYVPRTDGCYLVQAKHVMSDKQDIYVLSFYHPSSEQATVLGFVTRDYILNNCRLVKKGESICNVKNVIFDCYAIRIEEIRDLEELKFMI